MMRNKKGQKFVSIMGWSLGIIIFIFAAPMLSTIIGISLPGLGTATQFIYKIWLWVVLIILLYFGFKILNE